MEYSMGDGTLFVGCCIIEKDGTKTPIPDFIVENSEVVLLSKVEAEAELILRAHC